MPREASVYIETWDNKYVVVCNFRGLQIINNNVFNSYEEALADMARQIVREEIRIGSRRI